MTLVCHVIAFAENSHKFEPFRCCAGSDAARSRVDLSSSNAVFLRSETPASGSDEQNEDALALRLTCTPVSAVLHETHGLNLLDRSGRV